MVIARYTLRALLDKLDELLNATPGHESDLLRVALNQVAAVLRKTYSRYHSRNSRLGRSARRSGRSMTCRVWRRTGHCC